MPSRPRRRRRNRHRNSKLTRIKAFMAKKGFTDPALGYQGPKLEVPLVNSPELRIRFLVPEDVPVLKTLFREWFPIEYPDCWYQEIVSNSSHSVAAVKGKEIIGILVAEMIDPSRLHEEDAKLLSNRFRNDKIGYIKSLGVSRAYRRRGIGSFLLDNLTRSVVCEGGSVRALYLHVLSTNFEAISFYEKRGFKPHLFLPYFYSIKEKWRDGFTYVLYLNGGHPPRTLLDYIEIFCSCVFQSGASLFKPWSILKKLQAGWLSLQPRLRQIAHNTAAVFS